MKVIIETVTCTHAKNEINTQNKIIQKTKFVKIIFFLRYSPLYQNRTFNQKAQKIIKNAKKSQACGRSPTIVRSFAVQLHDVRDSR